MSKLSHLNKNDITEILSIATEYKSLPSIQEIDLSNPNSWNTTSMKTSSDIRSRLEQRIEQLSDGAITELTALTWLGRGDEGDFDSHLTYAKTNPGTPSYLAGKTPLADYLKKGLTQIDNK